MVLGTVEIGMEYGINNNAGMPSYNQAFDLLDEAWHAGIKEIDTASSYGKSETIIGNYQKSTENYFLIDTKLPIMEDLNGLKEAFHISCDKLETDHINILYLHSFEQCKNFRIISLLEKLKKEKKIKYIGVSVYDPIELKYILEKRPQIDVIQFPFNLIDCHRWCESGLIEQAKKNNKILYVRSVFLQGLIFKSPSDNFIKLINGEKYINGIRNISETIGLSLAELAYKFVQNTMGIDEIIIGCQTSKEFGENLNISNKDIDLKDDELKMIMELMRDVPSVIIDPRKWEAIK